MLHMSQNPYLKLEDLQELKNASRHHLDYLIHSGVRRDAPEVFEHARRTNLRLLDFVQFWENYPGLGNVIELKKPPRAL